MHYINYPNRTYNDTLIKRSTLILRLHGDGYYIAGCLDKSHLKTCINTFLLLWEIFLSVLLMNSSYLGLVYNNGLLMSHKCVRKWHLIPLNHHKHANKLFGVLHLHCAIRATIECTAVSEQSILLFFSRYDYVQNHFKHLGLQELIQFHCLCSMFDQYYCSTDYIWMLTYRVYDIIKVLLAFHFIYSTIFHYNSIEWWNSVSWKQGKHHMVTLIRCFFAFCIVVLYCKCSLYIVFVHCGLYINMHVYMPLQAYCQLF